MRKIYLLAMAAAISIASCKKDAKDLANVDQDIVYQEEIEFPDSGPFAGLPVSAPIPAIDTAFATNYDAYLSQYNTSSDKVIHAKMKELSFRLTAPAGQNFDFVDTLRVYVFGDDLPMKLAAYKYPVPKGQKYLELDVVDQNLKEYFLKDSVHVRLAGYLNALPANGTRLVIGTTFHLLANPLN